MILGNRVRMWSDRRRILTCSKLEKKNNAECLRQSWANCSGIIHL